MEICDLDELTTGEDVLEAVARVAADSPVRLVSLRRDYANAQTAVMVLQTSLARRLCEAGRIGLVSARVRQTVLLYRCYRYLAFRHLARECAG